METKIKIKVTERTTNDGKKKFNTYKTFSKNGIATEVKFRKEVTPLPVEDGYYTFNNNDLNLNKSGEYPVLWVRGTYTAFEPIGELNEEENNKKLAEYFGS